MKLLFTWLLGVPAMVMAMVLARAMTPQGPDLAAQESAAQLQACVRQGQLQHMPPLVAQNGDRIACDRLAVKH
jgi:hypothetical protein